MTELTVPYAVDLAAALHARRAERERQMVERQRREHALAIERANQRRAEFVAELNRYPDVLRVLSLFGVAPIDALIDRRTYAIYLAGEADLHGHRMRVVITLRDYSQITSLNILCACDEAGWEHQYRGHTVNTLADDLLAAAENLLARIEAAQDSRQADAIWGNDG
jgi:hypothetical protein